MPIKRVVLWFFLCSLITLASFTTKINAASSSTQQTSSLGTYSSQICGNPNPNLSNLEDITLNNVPSGKVYLKLGYQSSPINLSLYLDNVDNSCSLVGSALTSSNGWVFVGNVTTQSDNIIIQGDNVGAVPYQAAVNMVILTSDSICNLMDNCLVSYDGYMGNLQLDNSNLISNGTDQIAIFAPKPITNVGVENVSYYADNSKGQLYASSILKPFNRNYLDGGIHQTQIQVKLDNSESIYINQSVNMGVDWSGTLYLKSLIFEDSGQTAVFIISCLIIVMILIILIAIRVIYKRYQDKKLHGLDRYKSSDENEPSLEKDITVR